MAGHQSSDSRIPRKFHTHKQYSEVYHTILNAIDERNSLTDIVRLVIITDLAKDFDDLLAMIVLKELHRLGAIQILGFIANLKPALERARLGRGALDDLRLHNIPIAVGTEGTDGDHEVLSYEFAGSEKFIAPETTEFQDGQALLKDIFTTAQKQNYKVTLLAISSLRDIAQFARQEPELLKSRLEKTVFQGGYDLIDGKLVADSAATNNHFALKEAQEFHTFLQENSIPSICYTKVATFATPIYQNLLINMERTGLEVGKYLRQVQLGQDLYFWRCASGPVEGRFRPFMDANWFLKNKTTWYDKHPGEPGPEGEGITPWLDKVTAYDCLAAIGAAGDDIVKALGVIHPLVKRKEVENETHRVVGVAERKVNGVVVAEAETNIDGAKFATVIQALAWGSLLWVVQENADRAKQEKFEAGKGKAG